MHGIERGKAEHNKADYQCLSIVVGSVPHHVIKFLILQLHIYYDHAWCVGPSDEIKLLYISALLVFLSAN
jgi:hypothetical protein